MLVSNRDAGTVGGADLIQAGSALAEGSAGRQGRERAGASQRENGHRLPCGGENVDSLVPVL
jgi:hypothetical protein